MKKKSLRSRNLDEYSRSQEKDECSNQDDREILMFINKRKEENKALKKILSSLNTKGENKKDD